MQAEGDETLKRTKYLWLYSRRTARESAREKFAALRSLHLKTGRAWAIKESLRDLWRYRRKGWGLRHWKRWYFWATHSRLQPVIKVARMIRAPGQRADLLRASDHQRHERGAELEDPDGKKNAYGFRNRDHLKTAIFFHCGGLELYPVPGSKDA